MPSSTATLSGSSRSRWQPSPPRCRLAAPGSWSRRTWPTSSVRPNPTRISSRPSRGRPAPRPDAPATPSTAALLSVVRTTAANDPVGGAGHGGRLRGAGGRHRRVQGRRAASALRLRQRRAPASGTCIAPRRCSTPGWSTEALTALGADPDLVQAAATVSADSWWLFLSEREELAPVGQPADVVQLSVPSRPAAEANAAAALLVVAVAPEARGGGREQDHAARPGPTRTPCRPRRPGRRRRGPRPARPCAVAYGLPDARPVVGHGDDERGRGPRRDRPAERRVVEPPVVPTDEQRHGPVGERLERGLGRQHVGREAVVDELDRCHRAERTAAAGQPVEAPAAAASRASSDAPGTPRPASTARATAALRALCGPVRPRAADQAGVPLHLGLVDPADVGAEERRRARAAPRPHPWRGPAPHRAWCTATACRRSSARRSRASPGGPARGR